MATKNEAQSIASGKDQRRILAALEPSQLAEARMRHLPRRSLTTAETVLLWSLRVYLFFMIGIVVYQLLTGTPG